MWLIFFLENAHFALNFLAALVMFAVFWLYYEPWKVRRNRDEVPLLLGYLLLAISFVIHAVFVENPAIRSSLFGEHTHDLLLIFTRLPGYLLLAFGVLLDPLPHRPTNLTTPLSSPPSRPQPAAGALPLLTLLSVSYPLMAGIVGWLYWRRSTKGLEHHLRPVGLAFGALALTELLNLGRLGRDSAIVNIHMLLAPFGPVWIVEHTLLATAVFMLGRWVWQYLLKRLQSQLFMIFVTTILIIFLLTTVTFTGLLLANIRAGILSQLQTDSQVLQLSIQSKQAEMQAKAEVVANHASVKSALQAGDQAALSQLAQDLLVAKGDSSLVIVAATGQVLARGEDATRVGDSLSDDPVISLALRGESIASVIVSDGVVAPNVVVRAAAPIRVDQAVIGAVATDAPLDTAFVDGVKAATGLEAAIYGRDILSASTLVTSDNRSRWLGVKEESETVRRTVLEQAQPYAGPVTILHVPYFAAYLPLLNNQQQPVGMLFSGQPQLSTWKTAGRSIELTFGLVALLLVLSIVPAYLTARHIVYQLR